MSIWNDLPQEPKFDTPIVSFTKQLEPTDEISKSASKISLRAIQISMCTAHLTVIFWTLAAKILQIYCRGTLNGHCGIQGSYSYSIVKLPDFSSHGMTISLTLSKQ